MPTGVAADAPQPRAKRVRTGVVLILLGILVVIFIAALLLKGRQPPPVVMLPPDAPLKYDPLPDRWIPASWGWLWRLRDFVRGQRAPVNLDAHILELSGTLDLSQVPEATFVTNGLRVWVLREGECAAIHATLQRAAKAPASHPRMNSADGLVCELFTGQKVPTAGGMTDVGLTFQALGRTSRRRTDLAFRVKLTELGEEQKRPAGDTNVVPLLAIRTNLFESIRVQVPIGHGVVLVHPTVKGRPPFGMVLSVDRN